MGSRGSLFRLLLGFSYSDSIVDSLQIRVSIGESAGEVADLSIAVCADCGTSRVSDMTRRFVEMRVLKQYLSELASFLSPHFFWA